MTLSRLIDGFCLGFTPAIAARVLYRTVHTEVVWGGSFNSESTRAAMTGTHLGVCLVPAIAARLDSAKSVLSRYLLYLILQYHHGSLHLSIMPASYAPKQAS